MTKALPVFILAVVAAGAFFWFHQTPQAAPVPLAQVQGTSFDIPVKSAAPPAPVVPPPPPVEEKKPVVAKEEPKPVAVPLPDPKPEPKPEPKPVEPPKPAPAVEAPKPAPAAVEDKPLMLTFSKLAFRYWPQTKDKGARDPFPKEIKALNGRKVIMDGFMFPIDFEKGKVRSFILSNGMFGCCFGDSPAITETIKVFRSDGKLMPYQSMARVTGILEVGEEYDADGYVDSVYRIKADDVGAAQIEHK
jgi:hypothetical protein